VGEGRSRSVDGENGLNDLDDLLGDDSQPPPENRIPLRMKPLPSATQFRAPVTVQFLAEVMGKQARQIHGRLAKCPTAGTRMYGGKAQPTYDFMTAMQYLVTPKGDIEDWFATKNAGSLPPYINKMFWDSAHQRNRVMRSSNDLWHTDEVLIVLGRAAMMIKEEVKTWIEELPEKDILSNEQYHSLVDSTNRLLVMIRERLVEMPSTGLTEANMSHYIADELETGAMPVVEDTSE
jgi:hypothetical protein